MRQHKNIFSAAAKTGLLVFVPLMLSLFLILPGTVSAQETITCPDGRVVPVGPGAAGVGSIELCGTPQNADNNGEQASRESCMLNGGEWRAGRCHTYEAKTTNDCQDIDADNCGILRYLKIFINVLSALAGVVIVGSIVAGGIQYSMAGSDPQKVQAAKARIRNAIIALLLFIFGYGFLNYLVPGGVL